MYQELKIREFNKRLKQIQYAQKQELSLANKKKKNLHIVYVMSHVGVCGGVKIIFEHTNRLKDLGVQVTIVSHFIKPTWYSIEAEYIQVPFDIELSKRIPCCDVIVATYWDHIQGCVDIGIAPVIYFEQGDFHLFEYHSMENSLQEFIQKQLQLPKFIFTVSKYAASLLKDIYGRDAIVVNNAIDESIFNITGAKFQKEKPYLLMIGGEDASFKGLDDIVHAYELLKQEYNLDLYWVTPYEPSDNMKIKVSNYFVSPPQTKIAELYRGAFIYISASHYESFSLPPLEAMASGCLVVTTENKGVLEYVKDRENALVCNIRDPIDIVKKVKELLIDKELNERLRNNGLQTANDFKWEKIIEEIQTLYKEAALYQPKARNKLSEWENILSPSDFINKVEYKKYINLLKLTNADFVQVPVIYNLDNLPQIAKWEITAKRKGLTGNNTIESCLTYTLAKNRFNVLNSRPYLDYYNRNYEQAHQGFTTHYHKCDELDEKQVYFKWLILSLIKLQRRYEAREKIEEYLKENPYCSEGYYLFCLIGKEIGEDYRYHSDMVDILGDNVSCHEHILNLREEIIKP